MVGAEGRELFVEPPSAWAAITKGAQGWGLEQQKCISEGPGGWQPESRVPARQVLLLADGWLFFVRSRGR